MFTSRAHAGQRLELYEIGDPGRAVVGVCPCGSHVPRLELLGRYGDVVRIGTYFVTYRRFVRAVQVQLGYRGEVQLVVGPGSGLERLTVRLDQGYAPHAAGARAALATEVMEQASAEAEGLLTITVETLPMDAFERTPVSGRLRTVLDLSQVPAGQAPLRQGLAGPGAHGALWPIRRSTWKACGSRAS
ncbi:hypothetical protein RKE30_19865 [Streptomyces sp. Li-HN-5-11]|uniref:hypothetical protein n=1 Tax=Streptomyces sp. Li-HN-5-11 TaxID=3075432 RepID=UPI0028AC650B|nr:hypothetical protein [Streptomyces sp. Li-HN-5-11]WNM32510.1 hypothetical protein RKE30_19865 [Streptomyces sp. Li-HN-5-11]WOP38740.1 hypothetical protein RKE32_35770 [Streptomyces sp. Li-HN-5-13]